MTTIRIATRGSELALWQARYVAGRIEDELDHRTEIVSLKTTGDRLAGSLAKVGGKGLFVKEISEALLDGRADLAVHSAKDLPAVLDEALPIVAVPPREDPRDALCGRAAEVTLATLAREAKVGTGSVRRAAQLRRQRPDLEIVPLRGNVPTRLARLESEELDAVVLACAGLVRLGRSERIGERIDPELLLPAVAQGSLALQARRDDPLTRVVSALDDADASTCFEAERAFLSHVGGDCNVPIAALAELSSPAELRLRALVIEPDASRVAEAEASVPREAAARVGSEVASQVLDRGGAEILERARMDAT